jgi:16S rRNA (guanine1207-N2)-methyltransferase
VTEGARAARPADEAVYGAPPTELAAAGPGALQISPLVPGADAIEALPDGGLARATILAPPGTLERRYVLAHALRALAPDGELITLAPKTLGGARLGGELAAFGCAVNETARRHHRICHTRRPAAPIGLDAAIAAGAPRFSEPLALWTQPGVFSWDRVDPGTALLLASAGDLAGRGADLGCGVGVIGRRVLENAAVTELWCVDIDRRAVAAARRNLEADPRARFLHADVRAGDANPTGLDFMVMNPPFHQGGREDRGLGLAFIAAAAGMLRPGGVCRLVANAMLPYERALGAAFTTVTLVRQVGGYKVHQAIR